MFYPCLWKKVEGGRSSYFCSQECYNSQYEKPLLDGLAKEIAEWKKTKLQEIQWMERHFEKNNVKVDELEPNNRNYREQINNIEYSSENYSENYRKVLEIRDRVEQNIYEIVNKRNARKCDYCGKEIGETGYGVVDSDGNRGSFCSEGCREKGQEKWWKKVDIRKSALEKLLSWMKKEGITNISLDSDSNKLIIEYNSRTETLDDSNLTSEQREIKKFFQNNKEKTLSRGKIEEAVNENKGGKDKNNFPTGLIIGGAIIVIFAVLIGLLIYQNKPSKRKGH